MLSGIETTRSSDIILCVAYALLGWAYATRSPILNFVTLGPIASTSPAPSEPKTRSLSTGQGYNPALK